MPGPSASWSLRQAVAADVPRLAALYAQTARAMGPLVYTPPQVQAWVGFGADTPAFRDYILGADTWIADDPVEGLLGFSGIDETGEVRSLYVRHDAGRRGIGSTLLAHGLALGRSRGLRSFEAWATPFSRPVFARAGFHLQQEVQASFQGQLFTRYRVRLAT